MRLEWGVGPLLRSMHFAALQIAPGLVETSVAAAGFRFRLSRIAPRLRGCVGGGGRFV